MNISVVDAYDTISHDVGARVNAKYGLIDLQFFYSKILYHGPVSEKIKTHHL